MTPGNRMLLLIVDTDSERAANIEAQLRHLGSAVHATQCDHLSALDAAAPRFDLCVLALDGAHSLASLGLPALRERGQDCPVLVLGQPAFDCPLGAILAHGFADWVGTDDPLHLRESARRELTTVRAKRQSAALRDALLDSERRVERIMHNTRDAHAVIIDGVHANANNPYLRLLDLDPEHATATPFLDCVADQDRDAVRDLIRRFSRGEATDERRTIAFRTSDGDAQSLHTHLSAWVGDGERGVLVSPQAVEPPKADTPSQQATKRKHEPIVTAPVASAPDTAAPDATAPDTAAPDTATQRVHAPDAAAPEPVTPESVTPAAIANPPAPPEPKEPAATQKTEPVINKPHPVGGLAAELDDTNTGPVTDAQETRATSHLSLSEHRRRLRHAIRHNHLRVTLEPLTCVEDSSTHLYIDTAADDSLPGIDSGTALRRLADRVSLAPALDRWQLFVASRQAAQQFAAKSTAGKRRPAAQATVTLHVPMTHRAMHDPALPDWLAQLAGQYPTIRHTLWLPLRSARTAQTETISLRAQLDDIGMRLCLYDAFQHAGDLPDLRALAPHDICMHAGVLEAWANGKFSDENVQRLVTLLRSQGTRSISSTRHVELSEEIATRLGFCIVSSAKAIESVGV